MIQFHLITIKMMSALLMVVILAGCSFVPFELALDDSVLDAHYSGTDSDGNTWSFNYPAGWTVRSHEYSIAFTLNNDGDKEFIGRESGQFALVLILIDGNTSYVDTYEVETIAEGIAASSSVWWRISDATLPGEPFTIVHDGREMAIAESLGYRSDIAAIVVELAQNHYILLEGWAYAGEYGDYRDIMRSIAATIEVTIP
ncbi:MAG: hypothetical protein AAFR81_06910 [Chloroflexota bacterium]